MVVDHDSEQIGISNPLGVRHRGNYIIFRYEILRSTDIAQTRKDARGRCDNMHGNCLFIYEDSVANAANPCTTLHSSSFGGGPEFSHHCARVNARRCIFARCETYASSAMGTGWYNHATQGNRESSRKRTAHPCAHRRPKSSEASLDHPPSSGACQNPYAE